MWPPAVGPSTYAPALEASLRAYLYSVQDPPHAPLPTGFVFPQIKAGDVLPVNALTDYASLGELITRFNRRVAASHPTLVVDPSLVELRDALAHGRVLGPIGASRSSLFKFARPNGSTVVATFVAELNEAWFHAQVERVAVEVAKVARVAGPQLVTPP